MHDNCNPDNCPVNARVEVLKNEYDRYRDNSSKTHLQIFERVGALEQEKAATSERLSGIDEKLCGIAESVEEIKRDSAASRLEITKLAAKANKVDSIGGDVEKLKEKPGKRWDGMVDKLIWGIIGVLAGAAGSALLQLLKMGIGA